MSGHFGGRFAFTFCLVIDEVYGCALVSNQLSGWAGAEDYLPAGNASG